MVILQNSDEGKGFRMVISRKPNTMSKCDCAGGLAASLESPDESLLYRARLYYYEGQILENAAISNAHLII